MKGLSAQELVEHPGFKHLKWKLPADREGHSEVAKGRAGGPFKLWYEIHGKGDTRIVVSRNLSPLTK
jgi:hypothetical protein